MRPGQKHAIIVLSKGKPVKITPRQTRGLAYFLLCSVIFWGFQRIAPGPPPGAILPHNETNIENVIVELSGDAPSPGIYFLPPGATFQDLSIAADIRNISNQASLQKILEKENHYHFENGLLEKKGMIKPSKRLLLGLTLDINQVTKEDLMLIPQIGEKTAEQIIRLRQGRGGLRKLDELKEIKGIKEKRFNSLKKYFHVDKISASSVVSGQRIILSLVGVV